jgi:hypothetical protein
MESTETSTLLVNTPNEMLKHAWSSFESGINKCFEIFGSSYPTETSATSATVGASSPPLKDLANLSTVISNTENTLYLNSEIELQVSHGWSFPKEIAMDMTITKENVKQVYLEAELFVFNKLFLENRLVCTMPGCQQRSNCFQKNTSTFKENGKLKIHFLNCHQGCNPNVTSTVKQLTFSNLLHYAATGSAANGGRPKTLSGVWGELQKVFKNLHENLNRILPDFDKADQKKGLKATKNSVTLSDNKVLLSTTTIVNDFEKLSKDYELIQSLYENVCNEHIHMKEENLRLQNQICALDLEFKNMNDTSQALIQKQKIISNQIEKENETKIQGLEALIFEKNQEITILLNKIEEISKSTDCRDETIQTDDADIKDVQVQTSIKLVEFMCQTEEAIFETQELDSGKLAQLMMDDIIKQVLHTSKFKSVGSQTNLKQLAVLEVGEIPDKQSWAYESLDWGEDVEGLETNVLPTTSIEISKSADIKKISTVEDAKTIKVSYADKVKTNNSWKHMKSLKLEKVFKNAPTKECSFKRIHLSFDTAPLGAKSQKQSSDNRRKLIEQSVIKLLQFNGINIRDRKKFRAYSIMSNGIIELYIADPIFETVIQELKNANIHPIEFDLQVNNLSNKRQIMINRLATLYRFQSLHKMKEAILDGLQEDIRDEIIQKAILWGKPIFKYAEQHSSKNNVLHDTTMASMNSGLNIKLTRKTVDSGQLISSVIIDNITEDMSPSSVNNINV